MKRVAVIVFLIGAASAVASFAGRDQLLRTVKGVRLAPNVECADPGCTTYKVSPYVRTRSRYGIGCMGNVPPGSTPNPFPPPQSYSVGDIGKPGFPRLASDEFAMVRRIEHYVHSRTLRVAWVGSTTTNGLIVFDATDGPCEVWAGGYKVLNGGCNEFYEPGENPYFTHTVPECYSRDAHPPWIITTPRP